MEIDHLFVLLDPSGDDGTAAERAAARLRAAGLREGSSNTHPGQGTANRRFFFGNAMLELLYVTDLAAAGRPPADVLRLPARATERDACPFGIAFRPSRESGEPADFAHVHYRPSYLPDTLSIQLADGAPVSEPLWFHLPFAPPGTRWRDRPNREPEPRDHPAGLDTLTRVEIVMPQAPGALARSISTLQPIRWRRGERYRLTLCFDGERRSRAVEPVEGLPLVLRY